LAADVVRRFAAVELFVERAAIHDRSYALTDADVEPIAVICRKLDGIPLAIELAAGQVEAGPPPTAICAMAHGSPKPACAGAGTAICWIVRQGMRLRHRRSMRQLSN
jgi:hypothetical protein